MPVPRLAAVAAAALLAVATATAQGATTISLAPVASAATPTYLTAAPGDPSHLFVVEQRGTVRLVEDGAILPRPFVDLSGDVLTGGERGLLSIAFAPDYPVSGLLYAFFTGAGGTIHVWELHATPGAPAADPGHREILSIPHSKNDNHNGGQLAFGPDGMLYAGTGDGGGGGDPDGNGQNPATLLGKLLRIDPHPQPGGAPYGIPAGQPIRPGAAPEVYAYGLRNPWRFSFDRATGALAIGDVGQNAWEEVDYLGPGQGLGRNFGWNACEGTHAYPGGAVAPQCQGAGGAFTPPAVEYDHSGACSVTGGYVVRDVTLPALFGRYLYGDFCSGAISSFGPAGGAVGNGPLGLSVPQLASFGEDSDGHVYTVSHTGSVARLEQAGANRSPVASFVFSPDAPLVGQPVALDAGGSRDPEGRIASYSWEWTGDGVPDATGPTATATFASEGRHAVTLTVTDDAGATSTRVRAVPVGAAAAAAGPVRALGVRAKDRTAPRIRLVGRRHQRLTHVLRRGIALRLSTNEASSWHLIATIRTADGRRLGLEPLPGAHRRGIGTTNIHRSPPRTRAARLHLSRAARLALRRSHRLRVIVSATAVDGARNRAVRRLAVMLVR